jgi:chlorobactene glucosyltransferase
MAEYLSRHLINHLIVFQAVMMLIVLSNAWVLGRAGRHTVPQVFPKVSLLVPARNEEDNIERCVSSLLAQDYPNFEVLILDDQSTDRTRQIIEDLSRSDPRLQVLDGQPLQPGWLGKNWACAQLADRAEGQLLFFTDADTFFQPQTLRAAVAVLQGEQGDLLTGFPRQEVHSWGERFIVPLFSWAFYCFTPLLIAYRLKLPWLSNAIGQMLLFRREAYQTIGGHAAVRDCITEDLSLARRVKSFGLSWRVMDVTQLISCRMYRSGREAFAGLSKNLFAAFGFRLLPYVLIWLWLAVMFWEPLAVLAAYVLGLAPHAQPASLLVCILLSLLVWLIPYFRLGVPPGLAFGYPIMLLVLELVAFSSLWLTLTHRLNWKDRKIASPHWKWI